MNKFGIDLAVLIFFILFAGILSILLGQDISWDLANYHLYNPYAFLTGRIGFDIFPANVQTYFNPLLDLPYYFMVKYLNHSPRLVGFLQGQYYAVAAFMIYKIADIFFTKQGREKTWLVLFSVIIGISGVFMIRTIGMTFNDTQPAILALAAVYLLFKYLFEANSKQRTIAVFAAGTLLGAASGLKLTNTIFALAEFFVLCGMCRQYGSPRKIILYNFLGLGAGFLLTNGYWMWVLYSNFGNPFFPYFNKIFKSVYVVQENFNDMRFMPQTFFQWLFYPFYWGTSLKTQWICEHVIRDFRYPAMYISVLVIAFTRPDGEYFDRKKEIFLAAFTAAAYIIWLKQFSFLRYFLPVECLSGIIIMSAIIHIKALTKSHSAYRMFAVAAAIVLLSTNINNGSFNRKPFFKEYLYNFADMKFPDNAVVLMLEGHPSAAWIPFQNPKARFIGIQRDDYRNLNSGLKISQYTEDKIKDLIENNKDNLYLMYAYYENNRPNLEFFNKYIDTGKLQCKYIDNDFRDNFVIYLKVCH